MNADRMSAYRQWDLPLPQALHQEWERGKHRIGDGFEGAARFAGGQGRHGKFQEVVLPAQAGTQSAPDSTGPGFPPARE